MFKRREINSTRYQSSQGLIENRDIPYTLREYLNGHKITYILIYAFIIEI